MSSSEGCYSDSRSFLHSDMKARADLFTPRKLRAESGGSAPVTSNTTPLHPTPMPPSSLKRKDDMRLRLQKKLNTCKIDYHIAIGNHCFSVPVSMKPDQMAMLEKKGPEGCQLLKHVMHLALRDVLVRLPWQCNGCRWKAKATHTFGAPIYVPPVGKDNELERLVRDVYRDEKDQTIDVAHIRDKHPAFYCGAPDCLEKLQRAARMTNQRLNQKREDMLERVEYRANIEGVEFYSLMRLTENQLAVLDERDADAAIVLDRCMLPGLKMILEQKIPRDQPKGGPWNCMICSAVPAKEVYGSPMWIPADADANETEKFVRDYREVCETETDMPVLEHHHMRDKAPFFYCGSSGCKQEVHRRIDKINRKILLSVKKKLGKEAPSFDPTCCCSGCGKIVHQSVKDTCPRCRGVSYCNRQCRDKAWPVHKDVCVPARNERPAKRGQKHGGKSRRRKAAQKRGEQKNKAELVTVENGDGSGREEGESTVDEGQTP